MSTRIMLENVRLSYPKIFEPEQFNGQGDFAWSASFILDPSKASHAAQIAKIEAVMKDEFRAKCGNKFDEKWDNLDWDAKCLRDGKKKPENDELEGMLYVAARATKGKHAQPLALDRRATRLSSAGDEGAPYGGCYVNAQVDVWAQYGTYKRVNATLLAVQFARDGDAFGGGKPADASAFQALADIGEDDDDVSNLA